MSTTGLSKLPRKKRSTASTPQLPVLPDVILTDETTSVLREPSEVVAEVEARCAAKKTDAGSSARGNKAKAQNLHQEADQLYFKGDYESALVLYHRAAKLNPGNTNHLVAAKRASAAITASVNPDQKLGRLLRESRTPSQMSALVCPESAARRAQAIVAQSTEPTENIPKILKYFDSRKDFWRLQGPNISPRPVAQRSRVMQRQLNKCVKSTVQELSSAYESGDSEVISKLSDELINLVSLTDDPNRNRVETFGFLATKQIIAGRHDKAIDFASKMFFLARTTNDVVSMVNSLVILGRVHINFGHIDALVRVWERLVNYIKTEKIPQAWLYHDIGRCHLELGNYDRALVAAKNCFEVSESIRCKKWMIRGELLSGLALAKLGRYEESLVTLGAAMNLTLDEEAEKPIFDYTQEIVERVSKLARENTIEDRVAQTREELEAMINEEVEIGKKEDLKVEDQAERLLNVFQTLEKHLEMSKEEEEDPQPEEKINLLLERTRLLRRDGEQPKSPKSMLPRPIRKEESDEQPLSARTQVICRENETLHADDELTLSDSSETNLEKTQDAAESLPNEEKDNVQEEDGLDSANSSFALDDDDFGMTNFAKLERPLEKEELVNYLKSLQQDEFLQEESPFLAK